jgi:hypothetical protein
MKAVVAVMSVTTMRMGSKVSVPVLATWKRKA